MEELYVDKTPAFKFPKRGSVERRTMVRIIIVLVLEIIMIIIKSITKILFVIISIIILNNSRGLGVGLG